MKTNCWDQLYKESKSLTAATSIQDAFSEDDITFIESRLIVVIQRFIKKGELHKGIKVYIDKVLRNDYTEKMASQPPEVDQSLKDWCFSIFKNEKFGVVFNSLESYDNLLTERMCKCIHPLIKLAGIPLGGISFLFFMGNYGFTPFGIHKEAKGEEGFLFHMGPSNKTFYTWDIEKLNAIEHNTKVFHNVEEMLPDSESYELKPKSVMFIPNHLYHIANTEEFSFSVVMDYINPTQDFLEQLIAKEISREEIQSTGPRNFLDPISYSENEENVPFDINSWNTKYKSTLERYIKRLRSNNGILTPSILNNSNPIVDDNFTVIGNAHFPIIQFSDLNKNLFLMARGHEIPIKPNSKLPTLINDLNSGYKFSFEEIKELLSYDWEIYDIYDVLSKLINYQAVQKTNQ